MMSVSKSFLFLPRTQDEGILLQAKLSGAEMMKDSNDNWNAAPEVIDLPDDEVHVWRVTLNVEEGIRQALLQKLSADESARAERFRFQKDRDYYIVGRGVLRTMLGLYLNVEPADLVFRYTDYGKPYLDETFARTGLKFNLSNSHGLALYGITCSREIGIDIEYIRPEVIGEQIAEHYFSACEVKTLTQLSADIQSEAFFNCWTRKEAYIKARGEGLSLPLDQFDVSLAPGEEAALLNTRIESEDAARWKMKDLLVGSDYKAALAVKGHDWRLKCWQWPMYFC